MTADELQHALEGLVRASLRFASDEAAAQAIRDALLQVQQAVEAVTGDPPVDDSDEVRGWAAFVIADAGDSLFYDHGAADPAIELFEAALALDGNCQSALKGIIAAAGRGPSLRRAPRPARSFTRPGCGVHPLVAEQMR